MARESNVDKAIKKLCQQRGAKGTKIHGSAFQEVISDWLICYKGQFIALESKAPEGGPTPQQIRYLRTIRKCGGIAEVVYNVSVLVKIFDAIDKEEEWVHGGF